MIPRALVVLVLLVAPLAGCTSDNVPSNLENTPERTLNPWEAGLADHYPTPDVAVNRSDEERRANVAPPGDPEFSTFDSTMQSWMEAHDIPTGVLAIMKNGELRYEQGYGYVDRDATQAADAQTMMRIASVTKPIIQAVVSMQIEQGLYNWTDPVFCQPFENPPSNCRLAIEEHANRPVIDKRIQDIEVGHLYNHTAGWTNNGEWAGTCNEATLSSGAIDAADLLNSSMPLPPWRVAQWMLGAELAHDPGSTYDYCNGGYTVLGLITEAATGATLEALFDAYLFRPLDVEGEIEPGSALPKERNPREPFYACDPNFGVRETPSVFDPNETVCWPDGGWSMEAYLANGGLISTAAAVVAVFESLPYGSGGFALGPGPHWSSSGDMSGTSANTFGVDDDGFAHGKLQVAFMFNTREESDVFNMEVVSDVCAENIPKFGEPGCGVRDVRDRLVQNLVVWSTVDEAAP